MTSFLALGECMVEIAPAEGGLSRVGFAGDTFNTAWYARQLLPEEWTVSYGSCIGSDAISDEMASYMQSHGVDTSTLRRFSDRTVGLYMISLQDGERSFSYWRGQSAARHPPGPRRHPFLRDNAGHPAARTAPDLLRHPRRSPRGGGAGGV